VYGVGPEAGELLEVESLTPDIIEIIGFDESTFTVRGLETGDARVRTRTSSAEDVAPLRVRRIARVEVSRGIVPGLDGWQALFLETAPAAAPPASTIALVRGADPVELGFDLLSTGRELLVDTSADAIRPVASSGPEPTTSVEIRAGGEVFRVIVDVVDGPDRLVRHGSIASTVWALGPGETFCVAPMSGAHAIANHPLSAEVPAPWRVTAEESLGLGATFATCFLVELDGAGEGVVDVLVTDGSVTFRQPVEAP
jgi:hypothetical protein